MRVFIAGATGFIGSATVQALLARGDEVVVLSRSLQKIEARFGGRVQGVEGDPLQPGDWQAAVEGCDAVINLVGEPIADRAWSESQRSRIRDSRILSTRQLVLACEQAKRRPQVLVQGTAVGIYGERGPERLSEQAKLPSEPDFIAQLCAAWEQEALRAETFGLRVVLLRTGVVLDPHEGALAKLLPPFRLFAGGPLGDGQQFFPWIHRDDLVRLLLFALDDARVRGPLNGTAPEDCTMERFCQVLGRVLGRPSWLPVPRFALNLLLGERVSVVLASQRVLPERAQALGFTFQHAALEGALRDLLGSV